MSKRNETVTCFGETSVYHAGDGLPKALSQEPPRVPRRLRGIPTRVTYGDYTAPIVKEDKCVAAVTGEIYTIPGKEWYIPYIENRRSGSINTLEGYVPRQHSRLAILDFKQLVDMLTGNKRKSKP